MEVSKLDIIRSIVNEQSAKILRARDLTPFSVQKFELDLSSARSETNPFVIGFPFKTLWVKNGTTNSTTIKVKFNKNDSNIQLVELNSNDIISSDEMFAQCFISWDSQSGESIEVYAFVSAEIQTGALINSGTVTQAPNTVITTSVASATASSVTTVAADPNRKKLTIQNKTGGSIFLGSANTVTNSGATRGFEIEADQSWSLNNTDDIYLYCTVTLANSIVLVSES